MAEIGDDVQKMIDELVSYQNGDKPMSRQDMALLAHIQTHAATASRPTLDALRSLYEFYVMEGLKTT